MDGHLSFLEHEHGIHLQLQTKSSGVSSPHNLPVADHLAFEGAIVSVSCDHDALLGALARLLVPLVEPHPLKYDILADLVESNFTTIAYSPFSRPSLHSSRPEVTRPLPQGSAEK